MWCQYLWLIQIIPMSETHMEIIISEIYSFINLICIVMTDWLLLHLFQMCKFLHILLQNYYLLENTHSCVGQMTPLPYLTIYLTCITSNPALFLCLPDSRQSNLYYFWNTRINSLEVFICCQVRIRHPNFNRC